MTHKNVAAARRWVELFNERGDVDEFLSLHDPSAELQTPGGSRLHGHDQIRDWFEPGFENVQPRIIPERFVVVGRGSNRASVISWNDLSVGQGRRHRRLRRSGPIYLMAPMVARWGGPDNRTVARFSVRSAQRPFRP